VNRRTENTMVKRKRKNPNLQNNTQKNKDRATRTRLGAEFMSSERVSSSCYTCGTRIS